jgi:hypothetical protein
MSVDVGLGRPTQADRIGSDHACGRDDEHRLMTNITENVDVIGDLGGCGWGGAAAAGREREPVPEQALVVEPAQPRRSQ